MGRPGHSATAEQAGQLGETADRPSAARARPALMSQGTRESSDRNRALVGAALAGGAILGAAIPARTRAADKIVPQGIKSQRVVYEVAVLAASPTPWSSWLPSVARGSAPGAHPGITAHKHLHQHLGRRARPLRSESGCPGLHGLQIGLCPEAARSPARYRWLRLCLRHRRPGTRARLLVRVSAITGMGEFVFALWLVVRGRRIALCGSGSHAVSIGAGR